MDYRPMLSKIPTHADRLERPAHLRPGNGHRTTAKRIACNLGADLVESVYVAVHMDTRNVLILLTLWNNGCL